MRLLVMAIEMTKQTMFIATMMALIAADLPLMHPFVLIAYVMVSPSLYKISFFFSLTFPALDYFSKSYITL